MNRALLVALSLLLPLAACGRTPAAAAPLQELGKWHAGTNYQILAAPVPASAGRGKVLVVEAFWYGCGHCFAFDPALESWRAGKPAYVEFVRIPAMWGRPHQQHARLFYVLQALGRSDLHSKVFDAIHRGGNPLAGNTDELAHAMQRKFAEENGIAPADFDAAWDSKAVKDNLEAAQQFTNKVPVASVPLMVVNGRYSTGITEAGGSADDLLSLVNQLAASEKGR